MIPLFQIPRNSLVWLLAAQTLLIVPHLPRLPVWILLAWFITVLWRIQIFRGIWPFPSRWIKVFLVLLCAGGLVSEYRRFFGIEPMVGLLVTAFILKLLEMRQKRDALIVIFLGYFVAATQLLFSQTLLTSFYVIVTIVVLTTALLGMHQTAGHRYPWRSFRLAGTLVAQSIPLMVLLFIIMPRIGSLWAVPQQEHTAKTGVSDSMSPGDFSQLAQDNSTAFRVTFDGDIPPKRDMYWRGLVFSQFDGRRWSQSSFADYRGSGVNWSGELPATWQQSIVTSGEALNYEVILEATQQHWLYAIPFANTAQSDVGTTSDYRLLTRRPVRNRYRYEIRSHLSFTAMPDELSTLARRRQLSLPDDANPRARQEARQWMSEAESPRAYISRVLEYFNQEFTYTLDPPVLGQHPVDEFMWGSRRGFCEHFASAFVVMMRAAGIPARVVVGYQGGELNPIKDFLVVKQSDAHAWSEVWLEGEGWTRVDPTAAVAPERIESGSTALTGGEGEQEGDPFSLATYSSMPFFSMIALRLEVLEYDWHRLVMGYDQDRQNGLLHDLLGAVTPLRVAGALLLSGLVLMTLIAASLLLSGRKAASDPGEKLYLRFLKILKARGINPQIGEPPRTLAQRVKAQRPALSPWVRQVTVCYEAYMYAGKRDELARLRKLVKSRQSTVYSRQSKPARYG